MPLPFSYTVIFLQIPSPAQAHGSELLSLFECLSAKKVPQSNVIPVPELPLQADVTTSEILKQDRTVST
jgi:hypothetical protein